MSFDLLEESYFSLHDRLNIAALCVTPDAKEVALKANTDDEDKLKIRGLSTVRGPSGEAMVCGSP